MTAYSVKVRRYQETEISDFGQKLKAARIADGRSAQVLATLAGISTGYWYQLENEQRVWVSDEVVKAIESALIVDFGVSFHD